MATMTTDAEKVREFMLTGDEVDERDLDYLAWEEAEAALARLAEAESRAANSEASRCTDNAQWAERNRVAEDDRDRYRDALDEITKVDLREPNVMVGLARAALDPEQKS
jgi:hypothetical protein